MFGWVLLFRDRYRGFLTLMSWAIPMVLVLMVFGALIYTHDRTEGRYMETDALRRFQVVDERITRLEVRIERLEQPDSTRSPER